jgi:alkylated DNA nucleotide flippase Atl1
VHEVRNDLVHTLGNLTLTGYNGTLSNSPLERKQQIYAASHLELNRSLSEAPQWGRGEILSRTEELAGRICVAWPGPLVRTNGASAGFDWSRIHAVLAAIPSGRWTTYGDLAAFGGTSSMAVGWHLANTPGLANAYRVLGADGRPRPDFRWSDSADSRSVIEVLVSEGISFQANGSADPLQRVHEQDFADLTDLDAEELANV